MLLSEDRQQELRKARSQGGRPGGGGLFCDDPTPQELACLKLRCQGLSAREIGEKLFISRLTVYFHAETLFNKWGVKNIMQAYNEAMKRGLIEPPAREEAAL